MPFYTVFVGREKGIYSSWAEAQKAIIGHPGAIYRSFSRREEAESFQVDNRNCRPLKTRKECACIYLAAGQGRFAIRVISESQVREIVGNGTLEHAIKAVDTSGIIYVSSQLHYKAITRNQELMQHLQERNSLVECVSAHYHAMQHQQTQCLL